jgi:hypothetical protein
MPRHASFSCTGNFVLSEPFQHEMMSSEWLSIWRHEGMAALIDLGRSVGAAR